MDYVDSDKDTKKYFRKKLWWNLLKTLGADTDEEDLNDLRQDNQPTMFDLYIKNIGGDYRGRRNQINVKMNRHLGVEKFKKALKKLEKRVEDKQEPEQGVESGPRENFGFADFPKMKKKRIALLKDGGVGGTGKPGHYGVKLAPAPPGRPYDQPIKNRLGRGDQPPREYPPRDVDEEEEEMTTLEQMIDLYIDKLKMTQEASDEEYNLSDKEKNELDEYPKDTPAEELDAVKKDIGEAVEFDIAHMIVDLKLNEDYKEHFRAMMKKHGVKNIADLSPEKKKAFFRAVDASWKAKDEKAK
jgi:hypothetical protein